LAYNAEKCGNGHHPSMIGQLAPQWRVCELCQQVARAESAGPMGDGKPYPGYHLTLVPITELMGDDDGWE
jgi:hypothetical protein